MAWIGSEAKTEARQIERWIPISEESLKWFNTFSQFTPDTHSAITVWDDTTLQLINRVGALSTDSPCLKNSEGKIVKPHARKHLKKWVGLVMGDYDDAHTTYKKLAGRMRSRGLNARTISLKSGGIGMTGMGSNQVKRSVIIVPLEELQRYPDHILYRLAERLEQRFW